MRKLSHSSGKDITWDKNVAMSKLLKEQWKRLAFGKGNTSINESVDDRAIVDRIVQDNIIGDGPETEESFYGSLVRSSSLSDFETQVKYSPRIQQTFRDFLGDCDDFSIPLEAALGYVREKYAVPDQEQKNKIRKLKKWYGGTL